MNGNSLNPDTRSISGTPAPAEGSLKEGLEEATAENLIIKKEEIARAAATLRKYREGKKNLDERIVKEEEFWRRRDWKYIDGERGGTNFATPWLFNCVLSKYADVMDSYPAANLLARQRDDVSEAKKLSSIIPVIHAQNDFEATYSDLAWYTLKHGGGAFGVFWDSSKHNGVGDISVRRVDLLNLFWEPGVRDIQSSANVFHVELVDVDVIKRKYPWADGIGTNGYTVKKYVYDDKMDTSDKALVVDWYYKKFDEEGRSVLHYCKFCEDVVLFASENDLQYAQGWYAHGKYPFVVQAVYPVEGSICGEGLIAVGMETQMQLDLLNRVAIENALSGCKPRYFARRGSGIDQDAFADWTKEIVEVENGLGEDDVRLIETKPLAGNYIAFLESKIEELKYCTSNQDVNNGAAPSGITAASALAALQETGGKNSRSINKTFHRAFREVVYLEIELIRQFYDAPREFRVIPDVLGAGTDEFVTYDNANLKPQAQMVQGRDMGCRVPEIDMCVTVEKERPYKKMEINELALGFYAKGFFNPQMCDQALACLRMMDFEGKDELMREIGKNGTMAQRLQMIGTIAFNLAKKYDPKMALQLAQTLGVQLDAPPPGGGEQIEFGHASREPAQVARAREQARSSTETR